MASDYAAIRAQHLEDYGRKTSWRQSVLADRYSERTHFIYELLQNAEDAGASNIEFCVHPDRLEVRHNGRNFTPRDVVAICAIAESTKPEDEAMIGRFGIGFKSVYAYTKAPEVHCPGAGEHFEIRDFVEPWPVPERHPGPRWTTLFVFPFDRDEVPPAQSVDEIAERLGSLSARTVLFLRHLREFEWKVSGASEGTLLRDQTISDDARRVRLLHSEGVSEVDEEWLVFERAVQLVEGREPNRVEIAFLLHTDDDGVERAVPADGTELVSFFPTGRETHTGFLVQGPFVLTPARDNVLDGHQVNQFLAAAAAELLIEALEELRDRGLLDVGVLQALPLSLENFPDSSLLRPLYDAVRSAMSTRALLPTADGRHLPGPEVRIARGAGLRELFTPQQLGTLLGSDGPIAWASQEITSDRTPALFRYLAGYRPTRYGDREVPALVPGMEVDADAVVRRLDSSFLRSQTDRWMTQLYDWLRGQRGLRDLQDRTILRREDGQHVSARDDEGRPQIWLPPETETGYPVVRRTIAADEAASEFLRQLGLTEPDAVDDVLSSILPRYTGETEEIPSDYESDLERIARAYRSSKGDRREKLAEGLREAPFLLGRNAASGDLAWHAPPLLYEPTRTLEVFLDGNPDAWYLSEQALPHVDCWRELGVDTDPVVDRAIPDDRGYVLIDSGWGSHRRGRDGFDPDFEVIDLEYAVAHPNHERSLLIWNLLTKENCPLRGTVEQSTRQDYSNAQVEEVVSPAGLLTAEHAWLPTHDGEWSTPGELSLDDLHPDFTRDEALARRLGMRPTIARDIAEYLGIDVGTLGDLAFLCRHPELLREAIRSARSDGSGTENAAGSGDGNDDSHEGGDVVEALDILQAFRAAFDRSGSADTEVSVGDGRTANPDRRRERAVEAIRRSRAAEPPATDRWRVLRRKEWEARDPEIREYLLQTYSGLCQICGGVFARRDGEAYFEAKYIVSPTAARWLDTPGNAICLCPTCLTKMLHGSVDGPEVVDQLVDLAERAGDLPEGGQVGFILCGEPVELRFAQRHLIDLGALLSAPRLPSESGGSAPDGS